MSTTSRGPSRRTLVKGAAWSVPVVAVAGGAPAMAASPCIPEFTVLPTSQKCCSGQIKSYKLDIQITDVNGCVASGEEICITSIMPDIGNPSVEYTEYSPSRCTTEGGTITAWLYNASACTVNLIVSFTIGDDPTIHRTPIKADNVTDAVVCPIVPPNMPQSVTTKQSSDVSADVKADKAPATTDATAPAPVEPAPAPAAPAPAPADGAAETATP